MNINPSTVALARTARLVREAATPVYSTSTPTVREHLKVVELEDIAYGHRFWSTPMPEGQISEFFDQYPEEFYALSDIDCSTKCWCVKEGLY